MFEDFNPYSSKEIAEKLHMYAEASAIPTEVSPVRKKGEDYSFQIFTKTPSDKRNFGHKLYVVEIPADVQASRVVTFEGSREKGYTKSEDTTLEVVGENDIVVILTNYIEACQLFDDNIVAEIVAACKRVTSEEEIEKIAQTLVPSKDTRTA
jgi:hypothetical protein